MGMAILSWKEITHEQHRRLIGRMIIGPDCWGWRGGFNRYGYAQISLNGTVLVHRFLYENLIGPIPKDKQLDHLCRNRGCINPSHLEIVSLKENVLRGEGISAQNARKTHCSRGHEFTEANTINRPSGARTCRECNAMHTQRWRARNK